MTEHLPSLLSADQEQLELIPSEQMAPEVFAATEQAGEYTGARLFKQDRRTYNAIIQLRAEGMGILKVASILSVSPHTVMAVEARERPAVAIEKEKVSRTALQVGRMSIEGIAEDLADENRRKKISAKDKAIIAGVMVEKHQLLAGGATARIEIMQREPSHDDYNRAIEAECWEMGSATETAQEKAAGGGRALGAHEVPLPSPTAPAGDRGADESGAGASGDID